jgi:hypothetical protein
MYQAKHEVARRRRDGFSRASRARRAGDRVSHLLDDGAVAVAVAVAGHDARGLLRQARGLTQLGRDLGNLVRLGAGCEARRLSGQVVRRRALGLRLLGDLDVLAGLGVRPVEHRSDLAEVLRREAVELEVLAALDVRLALGDLLRRDPRRGEELHELGPGEPLERPRVGDLMDAAANQEVAGQRPRSGVVDHLVDLQLVVARARLEEEVVRQVLDQVAG